MSDKSNKTWGLQDAHDLYQIGHWGRGLFDINQDGNVVALIDDEHQIDLKALCDDLANRGMRPPLLLRFSDILRKRIEQIHSRFSIACEEAEYDGQYYGVYPIKVNQQRLVVEEIIEFGAQYNWGLEAGSKPELHATLPMLEDVKGLIICNGYKDMEFVELALMGNKMGKQVFIVVEKLSELDLILDAAKRLNVDPLIGLRCRLSTTSNGFWDDSGGDKSKFGLSASELLDAVNKLKSVEMLGSLKLLHFHIGSQVPEIQSIKKAMQEAARYFVEIRRLGAPIDFMDVGGGLGVNYHASPDDTKSAVNYSLQEYANEIIWTMKRVCDEEDLPCPNIISESGRAIVAHHSVFIADVIGVARRTNQTELIEPSEDSPLQLRQLWNTLQELDSITPIEALHDVIAYRDDMSRLFALGHATLEDRAHADDLYWRLITLLTDHLGAEEMNRLIPGFETQIADRYFCNFSVFQSLPDAWAIKQVFPVMPIHRLDERPGQNGVLVDITCDSDGTIQSFPVRDEIASVLPLHAVKENNTYLLGLFMTGAYQEILGDLHNLFGDTHAVHIRMHEDGYELEQVVKGETVSEVLDYVQFHETVLIDRMKRELQNARNKGLISAREANAFFSFYQEGLQGYTYLEEETPLRL